MPPSGADRIVRVLDVAADVPNSRLVVHYEVEAAEAAAGQEESTRKRRKKVFPVKPFLQGEIAEVAEDLVGVEPLLKGVSRDALLGALRLLAEKPPPNPLGTPSVERLDEYVENLYGDIEAKKNVANAIRTLCEDADGVRAVSAKMPLLSALARTLREDCSKSTALGADICLIFQAISSHSEYSQLLLDLKIPEALVKLINTELDRYATLYNALRQRRKEVEAITDREAVGRARAEYQKEYDRYRTTLRVQDSVLCGSMRAIMNLWIALGDAMDISVVFGSRQKLVQIISTLIKRVPPNPTLAAFVVSFLQRLSALPEYSDLITRAALVKDIVHSINPERAQSLKPEEVIPSLRLIFNLSCNPKTHQQMLQAGALQSLTALVQDLYRLVLDTYRDFFGPAGRKGGSDPGADMPPQKDDPGAFFAAVALKHPKPGVPLGTVYSQELVDFMEYAAGMLFHYSRILYNLSATEESQAALAEARCMQLVAPLVLGLPAVRDEVLLLLINLSANQAMSFSLLASGLLGGLARKLAATRSLLLAKVFANVTHYIPAYLRRVKAPGRALDFVATLVALLTQSQDEEMRKLMLRCIVSCPMSAIAEADSDRIMEFVRILLESPKQDRKTVTEAVKLLGAVIGGDQSRRIPEEIAQGLPRFLLRHLAAAQDPRLQDPRAQGEGGGNYQVALLFCILKACTQKRFRQLFAAEPEFLQCIAASLYQIGIPAPPPEQALASGRATPTGSVDRLSLSEADRPVGRLNSRLASGRSSVSDRESASEASVERRTGRTCASRLALKSASSSVGDREGVEGAENTEAGESGPRGPHAAPRKAESAPRGRKVKVLRSDTVLRSPYPGPEASVLYLSSMLAERIMDLVAMSMPELRDEVRRLRYYRFQGGQ